MLTCIVGELVKIDKKGSSQKTEKESFNMDESADEDDDAIDLVEESGRKRKRGGAGSSSSSSSTTSSTSSTTSTTSTTSTSSTPKTRPTHPPHGSPELFTNAVRVVYMCSAWLSNLWNNGSAVDQMHEVERVATTCSSLLRTLLRLIQAPLLASTMSDSILHPKGDSRQNMSDQFAMMGGGGKSASEDVSTPVSPGFKAPLSLLWHLTTQFFRMHSYVNLH